MIVHGGGYCMPSSDRCAHMLPGKKTDEEARAEMEADGWVKIRGKNRYDEEGLWDVCRLCQQIERKKG